MITRCSGVVMIEISAVPSPLPRTTFTSSPMPSLNRLRSAAGSVSMASVSAVHLVEQVLPQPGHRGELNTVGDLVQADPEAEVPRVDAELRSTLTTFGATSSSWPPGAIEEVELAEHLAGEKTDDHADLRAGHLAA